MIQLTSQIRVLELKLKEDLARLKEIYREQCDGSAFIFFHAAKPNQEELSARYEAMDRLAFHIEEAKYVLLSLYRFFVCDFSIPTNPKY